MEPGKVSGALPDSVETSGRDPFPRLTQTTKLLSSPSSFAGRFSNYHLPQSQKESSFGDRSGPLLSEMVQDKDKEMAERWKSDVQKVVFCVRPSSAGLATSDV